MSDFLVYKHTSPSGKCYIGQTCDYHRRCVTHKSKARTKRVDSAFSNAIAKYEWDNFTHEILKDGLTIDESNYWEDYYIKEFNSLAPHGYNLRDGGANAKASEQLKKKLSTIHTGRKRGPMSQETKDKISAATKGKIVSAEVRLKLSIIGKTLHAENPERMQKVMKAAKVKGFTPEHRANLKIARQGRIFTQETCEKISKGNSGKVRTIEMKRAMSMIKIKASKSKQLSLLMEQN